VIQKYLLNLAFENSLENGHVYSYELATTALLNNVD
jgi:hypothetical protein